jgi:hypothetical protein
VLTIASPSDLFCTVEKCNNPDFLFPEFRFTTKLDAGKLNHFVDDDFSDRLPWWEPSTNHWRFYRATTSLQGAWRFQDCAKPDAVIPRLPATKTYTEFLPDRKPRVTLPTL